MVSRKVVDIEAAPGADEVPTALDYLPATPPQDPDAVTTDDLAASGTDVA